MNHTDQEIPCEVSNNLRDSDQTENPNNSEDERLSSSVAVDSTDACFNRFHNIPPDNGKMIEMTLVDKNDNEEKYPMLDSKVAMDYASKKHDKKRPCCSCCGPGLKLSFGIIVMAIGILTFIFTPFDLLMHERLKMLPGFPAFDWWLKPPPNVLFKIYIFNLTNSDRFIKGLDDKLKVQEVGPVVFRELLEHNNTVFNPNDTLTYTAHRWLEYVPELNTHLDYNATVIIPNLAILGTASYLYDSNFLVKSTFEILRTRSSPIIKTSVYNYLWNLTDPLLQTAHSLVPKMVPIDNMGVLNTMYSDFVDNVTVFIGPKWGDKKFFTIDKFHGSSMVPKFEEGCKETFENSTEGLIYSQRITKQSKLYYWRKTLCKVVELSYEDELEYNGMIAYKFTLPNETYHRSSTPEHPDCYAGKPLLYNGLIDISKCFFDFPVAASLPHFYATDNRAIERLEGIKPDAKKHTSYTIIQPVTGTPLESYARSQSNLVIRKLEGFSKTIMAFSDITIPMFWAEYTAPVLPDYIMNLVLFTVKLPLIQAILSSLFVLIGITLVFYGIKSLECVQSASFHHHQQLDNFARKTIFNHEKDVLFSTSKPVIAK